MVLDRAEIQQWDLLLIGDGSGSAWDLPNGWATVLIDQETRGRKLFFGAASKGSVNMAEAMPYFQAMFWFHNAHGVDRIKRRGALQVHIITDSQVTVNHGRKAANLKEALPKIPHRPIWAGMREFGYMGYEFHWHWAPRSTNNLNWASDLIAALARREILLLGQDFDTRGFSGTALAARAAESMANVQFQDPADGSPIDLNHLNPD